jgi:hypothetical protein
MGVCINLGLVNKEENWTKYIGTIGYVEADISFTPPATCVDITKMVWVA